MSDTKINIEALKERTADDQDLALELLKMLKDSQLEYQNEITGALNANNFTQFAASLHKFKSAVGVLGFLDLADQIQNVEKKVSKKIPDKEYSTKINRIFISLNNHIVELEKILKNSLWDY